MQLNAYAAPQSPAAAPAPRAAYVLAISLVAALGGLLFGYDWVVIGGAKPFFESYFAIADQALRGWVNSCALLGCLAGALLAGGLSDWLGRKKLLLASAILFGASSVLTGWADSVGGFVLWRIAGGVAIGMASALSPMYIAEVAPSAWRGRLVALNQLTIVIGILLAQIVNLWIARGCPNAAAADVLRESWYGQFAWRWMFTAVAGPSIAFFLLGLLVPESPRWLMRVGREATARRVLQRIGGADYAAGEVAAIQQTLVGQGQHAHLADLLDPAMLKILLLGCLLAALQQWSGINVFFNYAEEIFRQAGYGVSEMMFNIVITGSVNLVFTLLAIATVDRLGRRTLMLVGCALIAAAHVLIGVAYLAGAQGTWVLVLTLAAIGFYAMSLAPVTWVLIAEIFPNRIRGSATAIAVSALWIACFLLTYLFPILNDRLGPAYVFWLFAAICGAGFLLVWAAVPETKGRSLEEIEARLTGRRDRESA